MKKYITTISLTLFAVLLATTAGMADAEAASCPGSIETLEFHIPGDRAVVPEAPTLFGVFEGDARDQDREVSLVDTGSGQEIEVQEQRVSLARNDRTQIFFVPEEDLDAGEYQLTITSSENYDVHPYVPPETTEISFTVDSTRDVLPTPDTPGFGWYNERHETGGLGGCSPREWSVIEIDRPSTPPDYYEVVMRDEEGSEDIDILPASDEVTEATIIHNIDTDCVTLTAVMADGTRGESVEDCSPRLFGPGCFSGCQATEGSWPSGSYWLFFAALFGLFALNRRRDHRCKPHTSSHRSVSTGSGGESKEVSAVGQ